jgi:ABC-2 type transport system ATP-binding protein
MADAAPAAMLGPDDYARTRMTLVVDHLAKRFGSVIALDDLSFEVAPGQVFGFLGANGAGKTTTMRIALGVLEPDAGRITWRGIESRNLPRATWGYLPEERGLYPRMRVIDQLAFFAGLHGVPAARARREGMAWLHRFRAEDLAERRAEQLSKGNQQKVQFIAAVLHDPPVMLMDEPFTGLDPVNVMLLREAFLELRDRGRTVVFSTHQMEVAEAMCEAVAIVDRGRVVVGGPLRDVKRSTGRRMVRISVADDHRLPWLAAVPGTRIIQVGMDRTSLELEPGVEPDAVLAAAVAAGARVTHFEIADPSLEQVFIDFVGHPPDEETHLAPVEATGDVDGGGAGGRVGTATTSEDAA